jgi:hypothetical protein
MMNKLSKISLAVVLSTLLFSCSDEGSSNSQVGEGGKAGNSEGTNVEGGTYIDGDKGNVTTE